MAASKPRLWAAGLVLLAAWMPFNNGLRPEGQIAAGALITYVLIERAIISGRLTPAALAIITAAFTLGIQPTGLIAVAALLAGGRPLLRILVRRRRMVGTWPLVAPLLAAGHGRPDRGVRRPDAGNGVGSHQDSHRDRAQPGLVHREPALLLPDPADRRRFAVAAVRLPDHRAVPVHRDVHHVAAQADSRRRPRPGVAADGRHLRHHVLPDVHPHQVGPPLRAVRRGGRGDGGADHGAGVAGRCCARSRNRMAFLAAVLFVLALCFATTNGWWYVSSLRRAVQQRRCRSIGGVTVSTIFFALFAHRRAVGVLAALRAPDRGEGRLGAGADRRADPGRRRLHGAGVRGVDGRRRGAPVPDLLQRLGQRARLRRRLRAGRRRARRTRRQRRLPDAAARQLMGPLGPLGGAEPVGFTPNGVPDRIVAEAIRMQQSAAGHRLRLGRARSS